MASDYPYREVFEISEFEAMKNFWMQVLTGDSVDSIQGVPGIGKKKAEKILEGCGTEEEMYDAVFSAYRNHMFPNGIKHPQQLWEVSARLEENAKLLFMIRELDENNQPIHWRAPA